MGNAIGKVAVWRFADVVALGGVLLETAPSLLKHLQDVPLSHALLYTARQDLGGLLGARATEVDGLVRGQQRYTHRLKPMLDEGAEVRPACYPFDGLADHRVKVPRPRFSQGKEVLDATVAWNGDGETLVTSAVSPCGKILAPGFDVVVEADDDDTGGQHVLARAHLPGQRNCGVLLVLCGSASKE
ncbi:hypothetical protein ACQEU8_33115 [Streptomyces sp. CA-250714]|uniref:hypothetical protein n=1 Tax=Streptomyces sp. CA-250714 TaxID=3240060 RepID=UPI003D9355EC